MGEIDCQPDQRPASRLCGRGSTKMPAYLLPSLMAARAEGRPTKLLTLAVAGWCRYLQGHDVSGNPIEIKDSRKDILQSLAVAKGADPRPLLGERDIFGDLGDDPEFVRTLESAIRDIEEYGPAATIAEYLSIELLRGSHPAQGRVRNASRPTRPSLPADNRSQA
ncbi:hypothetical protein [Actinoplanes sp. NPDC026623]|uniref:mannitol dehydrogenase family protein n=1 Tax=Actinoplanes sp. NPDC026623 TaxID=3155610 RepID=UPI00340AF494